MKHSANNSKRFRPITYDETSRLEKTFCLNTNASNIVTGAVLLQELEAIFYQLLSL